jgi:hypothetical protein
MRTGRLLALLAAGATAILATAPAAAQICEPAWIVGEAIPGLGPLEVRALVVYDDGDGPALYIGGGTDIAGTVPASAIVRWDGAGFSNIGDLLTGGSGRAYVSALAVYAGKLVVGGSFRFAGGVEALNIATWDGAAWSPLGSGITGGQGGVWDLFVHEGRLIVTGSFNTAGGVPAANIAAWDGTSWSALGAGLAGVGTVGRALTAYEGDLVVGGIFSQAGGVSALAVARWDGAAWSPFGDGLASAVYALATFDMDGDGPDPDRLVAGGTFSPIGIDNLAYWDGADWQELAGGTQNSVFALLASGEDLYVGGSFNGVGGGTGNAEHVARWHATAGWSALGEGLSEDLGGVEVFALAEYAGSLFAGGNFGFSGQQAMHRVARWDGAAWWALAPGMGGPFGGNVLDLLAWEDGVVVAGAFTSVGPGVDANNVALWTPTGWSALGGGLGNGEFYNVQGGEWVEDLALHGGELYAAWYDYNFPGSDGARISRWDGANWQPVAVTSGANQNILALQSLGGELYAAGSFTTLAGFAASRVARWDGASWHPLGTGVNGQVNAMTVFEGRLVVGGTLTQAGGGGATKIARWDGANWTNMGAGLLGSSPDIHCFAYHEGALYAGGNTGVYRWEGSAWTRVVDVADVWSLLSVGSELYFTGRFSFAGGTYAENIARWDGSVVRAFGSGLSGSAVTTGAGFRLAGGYALELLADGTVAVGSVDRPLAGGEVSYGFARIEPCQSAAAGELEPTAAAAWQGLRFTGRMRADGGASFALDLPLPANVELTVYDAMGREVGRWRQAGAAPGARFIDLEVAAAGRRVPSGVYFGRLVLRGMTGSVVRSARAVHLR